MIAPGSEWTREIDAHLNTAQIILLLVSADFLASEYCYSLELRRVLERQEAGETRVIPILLRPVDLRGTPLENLLLLPKDGKSLTSSRNLDGALLEVAQDVQRVVKELIARRAAPPIWHVSPNQRNPFFTGREEVLQQLHDKLNEKIVEVPSLLTISGIAGIGKTQVALEYAYRYRDDYRAVLWTRANERGALIADFATIASLLNLPEKSVQDMDISFNAVKHWLASNGPWLFILEDVEDIAMARDFIPTIGEGHIILTTRLRSEIMGLIDNSIVLHGLRSDEGALLLFRQARLISSDATLEDVSREDCVKAEEISLALEGIPFLLARAGAYIEETGVSLSDFLDLYRKRSGNLLGQQEGLSLDYPASAAIIQSLVEEEQLVTYDVFLSIPSEPISIGGKLEVAIYLSVAGASSSGYSLAMHKDEAARGELNLFLNAQGFQVEGNNTACLPFPFSVAGETISNSVTTQVARFNLIALRPGPAEITVELYRNSAFETTLKAEAQVNSVQTGELPQPATITRPRSVLLPEFLLQVSRQWNETESACAFHYSFSNLRSSLLMADGVDFQSGLLSPQWIEQAQALLDNTLEDITGSLREDAHTRLVSLGQYLFQHLIPSSLQQEIRRLAVFRQTFTLLIFADQDTWVPWELLHDGQAFLSERFIIGRWPHELNDTCPYEYPIGALHIAYYANVRSTMAEKWASLLEVPGTPPPTILPDGLFDSLSSLEEMRGVHLIRFGSSSQSSELQDAPTRYVGANESDSVERELRIAKLNLRRNRPLVSLGYLSAGLPELTMLEQTWAPAFLRAGCSAFIGPLWAVQQTVAVAFTTGFYRRLWAGDSLGTAFSAGRRLARAVAPESLDWLGYVLFGDPMARPYLPVKGQGYAVIEPIGREMDDLLPPSGAARFRVSLRRMPPVWHEQRVIEVAEDLSFEKLEVNIVTSSLQVQPASPIEMMRTPTGDYMGWFTLTVPYEAANRSYIVQIYFMNGVLPIHRLRFSLKVGKRGGDQP